MSWDDEKILDEQITPLAIEITRICKEHNIPFVLSVAYAPDFLCTSALSGVPDKPTPFFGRVLDILGTPKGDQS